MSRVPENMRGVDCEDESLFSDMPRLTTSNSHHSHYHTPQVLESRFNGGSSSYVSGFCFSEDGSPSPAPFLDDSSNYQTPDRLPLDVSLPDCLYRRNGNGYTLDELGLARQFHYMNVEDRNEALYLNSKTSRQFGHDTDGFRIRDFDYPNRGKPVNGENLGSFDCFPNEVFSYGGFQPPAYVNLEEERAYGLGQRGSHLCNSRGSFVAQNHPDCMMNFALEDTAQLGGGYRGSENPLQEALMYKLYRDDDRSLQQRRLDLREDRGTFSSSPCHLNPSIYRPSSEIWSQNHGSGNLSTVDAVNYAQFIQAQQALAGDNVLSSPPSLEERMRVWENRVVTQPVVLTKNARRLQGHDCGNNFILQENGLNGVTGRHDLCNGRAKSSRGVSTMSKLREKSLERNAYMQAEMNLLGGRSVLSYDAVTPNSKPVYKSLAEVRGNIYSLAKDQNGCRFLQRIFEEGSSGDVRIIFNEVIDYVVELMMNPFGNYLIQKLLDVCDEEQRMKIVHTVARERGQLVKISLNTHGTRVVQKLIDTLKTRKQITLVVGALEPGFLDLIKDLNGNHVVQRCLQCLSTQDNKFIFDAAAKYCVDIATHRHGCCVLQRCIHYSRGEQRKKMVAEIVSNALYLAQDPFGNYVVQYIIELKVSSASAGLISRFQGNFVHLSMQKCSSHVVEKCLKYIEESRPIIVDELLSVSHFEELLQDPYANYVIHSALEVTKGRPLHSSLVDAVRPHESLRTNPHCKKIFSRSILKK